MAKIIPLRINVKEDALLQSIDETFTILCSASVRESFYDFLEKEFKLRRDEIPSRLDLFVKALEKATGSAPSEVIMKNILKRFCARLGVEFNSGRYVRGSFKDAVINALRSP